MASKRLSGRKAIVTGAASGIGAATAARLRADGAQVFTADLHGNVDFTADLTEPDANARLVEAAVAALDGLDTLVPCAGISAFHALEGHDDAYFLKVLDVNLVSVFRLIRDAVPHLKAAGNGRIVTIGSTTSSHGDEGLCAYSASKHAVLGLTKSVAAELGPFGVTVNCVQPGAIATPMTAPAFTDMPEFRTFWENKAPLRRLGQPEDIADVIAFLCSDDARFMSGHGVWVDGGAMVRH
ncbi:MAG: short-chain dehydrogenase [Novosphingobium sp. 28-62-57]|uniref:SDR family NAD(P)-dependent oxidoreductase n=1 Tax=unclassified Novosphingobium TaxID=2644732 RepID=UPI000BD1D115|nr:MULTISPECIES: SDR family NAD(P)-dependent oxidoreductase [unclassified Novosphingobium]OYW49178.1 MAG: short-chain dehydrogenase [Novosphingobium sp. 12-62-10]OYZ09793.1 MAG: short-chain dehydrogenase [Novosphingobium sp. 28-62-57]OZA36524.1 MAG: short-chain dehydrogenase [Novosphingobium sp. 17-62-9]HQS69195.1 SDR family NAD(P)-dependent oxidoreductase [Novosphingobium sp.]